MIDRTVARIILPCQNKDILLCKDRMKGEVDNILWCTQWRMLQGKLVHGCEEENTNTK